MNQLSRYWRAIAIGLGLPLSTVLYAQKALPSFNYDPTDPDSYSAAKQAFVSEFQPVVDHLQQTKGGNWGYTDILNLWDYREEMQRRASGRAANPDNLFTIANQVVENANNYLGAQVDDMVRNEEYYQIRLLMMIANPHSEKKVWNPLATVVEDQAIREMRNVIDRLKLSGDSVEFAEELFTEYRNVEKSQRELAIEAARRLVQFKEARCRELIEARKQMYRDGILPHGSGSMPKNSLTTRPSKGRVLELKGNMNVHWTPRDSGSAFGSLHINRPEWNPVWLLVTPIPLNLEIGGAHADQQYEFSVEQHRDLSGITELSDLEAMPEKGSALESKILTDRETTANIQLTPGSYVVRCRPLSSTNIGWWCRWPEKIP